MEEPPIIETPSRLNRIRKSLASPEFKLYCSYFFSSWGDRMWSFSLGIALGVISGDLQYTATSGLVNSSTVLLFASLVGRWVDKTGRLNAARMALIVNNFSVATSAALLVVVLFFPRKVGATWHGDLSIVLISASIILCAVSMLANCATKICITKDWVVVIAGSDKERLADINAVMVRIDMASMVLSPLLAGQIMTSFGTGWGCAFIGCWNVGSFFIEYLLQMMVYKSCPALAVKRGGGAAGRDSDAVAEGRGDDGEVHADSEDAEHVALTNNNSPAPPIHPSGNQLQQDGVMEAPGAGRCNRCCWIPFRSALSSLIGGYEIYFRQSVLPAGLALASLYLTVLGFDGTTTVYILSLGLAENWIAACNGLGAIMGFSGSVLYPRLRRNIGLHRTGRIALSIQWSCLLLPVASVWLPGSNFDPDLLFGGGSRKEEQGRLMNDSFSTTEGDGDWKINNTTTNSTPAGLAYYNSRCSSIAFITGIVLSRMGLWLADLTISQLFQEQIAEHERGVVNGVQNSINSIMDIVKGILVIILPDPRTFGLLILISWASVFFGYACFCYYSRSQRGHLLPFHKQFSACVAKDGTIIQVMPAVAGGAGALEMATAEGGNRNGRTRKDSAA